MTLATVVAGWCLVPSSETLLTTLRMQANVIHQKKLEDSGAFSFAKISVRTRPGKSCMRARLSLLRVLGQEAQGKTHVGGRVVDDCRRRPVRRVLEAEVLLEDGLLLAPVEHAQDARSLRLPQHRKQVGQKPDARVVGERIANLYAFRSI